MSKLFWILSVCIFNVAGAHHAGAAQAADIVSASDRFWRELREAQENNDPEESGRRIVQSYERNLAQFDAADVAQLTTPELGLLLNAARAKVAYSQARDAARVAQKIGMELQRRGELKPADADTIADLLVATRQVDRAADWTAHSHSAFIVPSVIDRHANDVHSEWRLTGVLGQFVHEDFVFPAGPYVVIVSHPLCHFSNNAAQAIQSDTYLRAALHNRVKWLVPQQLNFDARELAEWNGDHPDQQLSLAYLGNQWPEIRSWATPTFYFFNDGKLISSFSGWPVEGRKDMLISQLNRIKMFASVAGSPSVSK